MIDNPRHENPPTLGRLLKGEEIARILNISRTAAYRLMRTGELPVVRFGGGTVRVRPADLDSFIADHAQAGPNAITR